MRIARAASVTELCLSHGKCENLLQNRPHVSVDMTTWKGIQHTIQNILWNNKSYLWICLQSFRITNMPQVLDLILLTTKICLTELAHPRHPLLGSLLQVSIPWTVIAERPKIKFDLWQVKAALEMSVTGVLAGMLFVNCVISVCVLSISHITASLSFSFHLAYTGSLRSGLLLVPFRRS